MNDLTLLDISMKASFESFFKEDDISNNDFYHLNISNEKVRCILKFKSNMVISGLPYFLSTFRYLAATDNISEYNNILEYEGKAIDYSLEDLQSRKYQTISFNLPFNIALTGERIALNLLQRASSIATITNKFVKKAEKKQIAILDTRKTTPGLRSLEKYAVRVGGGDNHRFGQTNSWMIKDNHKEFYGGLKEAWKFFKDQKVFYNNIVVEIHDLNELEEAEKLGVTRVMLDNFCPKDINLAIENKPKDMTYEISGGINLANIDDYLIKGVDAISIGALTHSPKHVDISLDMVRE